MSGGSYKEGIVKDLKTLMDCSLEDLLNETNTAIENKRGEYERVTNEFRELNKNLSLIIEELNSRKAVNTGYDIPWLLSVHDEYGRESIARSKACDEFLESLGFRTMGYYPDTDQVAIHIRIKENSKASVDKALKGIETLLPYIKKHEERHMLGCRFEIDLDYSYSYYLEIVSPNEVFIKGNYGTFVLAFCTIRDALFYISKHMYYRD